MPKTFPKTNTKIKVATASSNVVVPMLSTSSTPKKSLLVADERRNGYSYSGWVKVLLVFFVTSMVLGVMFRGDIAAMLGRLVGNRGKGNALPDDGMEETSVARIGDTAIAGTSVSAVVSSDISAIVRAGSFDGMRADSHKWSPFVEAGSTSESDDTESVNAQKPSSAQAKKHPQTLSITDGLVAYYPFNGNANDETGHGNNGVVHGAILTTDRLGNPNKAYEFNGKDACIIVEDGSQFNFVSDMSVATWVNPRGLQCECSGIFDKYHGRTAPVSWAIEQATEDQNSYILTYGDGNKWSGYDSYICRLSIQRDVWSHIAVIKSGSTIKCYLNGELVGIQKAKISYIATNGEKPLSIGCEWDMRYFNGAIDEARFYNRALFPEEVKILAGKSSPPPSPSYPTSGFILAGMAGGAIATALIGTGFFCYHKRKCLQRSLQRRPSHSDTTSSYGATDTDPLLGLSGKPKSSKRKSSEVEYQKAAMQIARALEVRDGVSIQEELRRQEALSRSHRSTLPSSSSSSLSHTSRLTVQQQSFFAHSTQSPTPSSGSSSVNSSSSSSISSSTSSSTSSSSVVRTDSSSPASSTSIQLSGLSASSK